MVFAWTERCIADGKVFRLSNPVLCAVPQQHCVLEASRIKFQEPLRDRDSGLIDQTGLREKQPML